MADPVADAPTIKAWLDANQQQAGTPDFVTMKGEYDKLTQPQAPVAGPRVGVAPPINYRGPIEDVRTRINAIPEGPGRDQAWQTWGDYQEQKRVKDLGSIGGSLSSLSDLARTVGQGLPGGSFLDELNAKTISAIPPQYGGMPYEEAIALQRARDRRIRGETPGANVVGNVTGAVMAAPYTAVRAASVPLRVGADAVVGGIQGAGEAEGGVGNRAMGALKGASTTAALSLPLQTLGSVYSRYSHVTPEVTQAADQLGVRLPFFMRAADPAIQGAGRQAVQEMPSSSLARSFQASRDATETAAGNTVRGVTGAPPATAPYAAGTAVRPGMEGAIDAASGRMGQLADETNRIMPPGGRYDMPATRAETDRVISERAAGGANNPEAGLGPTLNMTTNPQGVTWPGVSRYVTETGDALGQPPTIARDISDADLARIYRQARSVDQPAMVEQAAGPAAAQRFGDNVARQRELADLRRSIDDAIKNQQPEQLINLARQAATVGGAGTRLETLQLINQSLSPQQRQQLGAGVFAKMLNEAGGSPAALAKRFNDIPDAAHGLLFPPGTQLAADVANLRTLAERGGAVDNMRHVGSAASIAPWMRAGGVGTGSAGLALLAHQLNMLPELGAAAATAGAAKGAYNYGVKPLLLQHGLPPSTPALRDAINNLTTGTVRGVGQ